LVTDTDDAVGVPLRAPGIPLFSARLLAIEEFGRRRCVGALVGDEVLAGGETALAREDLVGGGGVASSEGCGALSLFFSSLRGGSLIKCASLRWCSSRSARIRMAYSTLQTPPLPKSERKDGLPPHRACLWPPRGRIRQREYAPHRPLRHCFHTWRPRHFERTHAPW
jgi:hypothetical protein